MPESSIKGEFVRMLDRRIDQPAREKPMFGVLRLIHGVISAAATIGAHLMRLEQRHPQSVWNERVWIRQVAEGAIGLGLGYVPHFRAARTENGAADLPQLKNRSKAIRLPRSSTDTQFQ
jgi:hypothetical protein